MVIMMTNWYSKYRNRPEFMAVFDSEQEYVDAMFVMIVMFNFGIYIDVEKLRTKDAEILQDT